MCGRYTLFDPEELLDYYGLLEQDVYKMGQRFNAAPGQNLPVVTNLDGKPHLGDMRWGLIPFWAKDTKIGYKMINARAESVFDKPTWKQSILKRRCLVPSNGFYEWKKEGDEKQPYFIHPKDRHLYSFAGLYDHWTNKESGEVIESFSILTTEPNDEMQPIHDRMPLILHKEDEQRWLDATNDTPDSIADLFKPYDNGSLEIYKVDRRVGNVRNNMPELVQPLKD